MLKSENDEALYVKWLSLHITYAHLVIYMKSSLNYLYYLLHKAVKLYCSKNHKKKVVFCTDGIFFLNIFHRKLNSSYGCTTAVINGRYCTGIHLNGEIITIV